MLKIYFVLLLVIGSITASAQIPSEYYSQADGLSGDNLKSVLHNIIKDHTEFPYTGSSTDTWDILKQTDKDTLNPNNVILFYTGWSVNAGQEFNNGQGWNREHVWAKSHGGFSTSPGPGTDAHNLRPSDISVNAARDNKDFDNGGNIYVDGDGTTNCRFDSDSWEARDEVKGDIARILFYMAVRYEGENGEPDLELIDQVNTSNLTSSGKGYHGKLSALLEWHKNDPVDSYETNRNNVIYSFQENRNPFIDHPEYVDKIWGNATSSAKIENSKIRVYPNPAKDYVIVELESNQTGRGKIISLSGKVVSEFTAKNRYTIYNLEPGVYLVQIATNREVFISKLVIN